MELFATVSVGKYGPFFLFVKWAILGYVIVTRFGVMKYILGHFEVSSTIPDHVKVSNPEMARFKRANSLFEIGHFAVQIT